MWPEPCETERLLAEARDGDASAVEQLLQRHRPALRRLIDLRLDRALVRRVDASDIVQDVLIDANRRLAAYLDDPTMPFHLWLRHLARDRMIDAHRRHRQAARRSVDREQPLSPWHRAGHSTLDLAAQLSDNQRTPAAAALWEELQRRFQGALEQMGEQDRKILIMRHFEQLSNQETARALQVTGASAGMRYLRAIRRLRSILSELPARKGPP